jgi:hypothetical protein
MVYTF